MSVLSLPRQWYGQELAEPVLLPRGRTNPRLLAGDDYVRQVELVRVIDGDTFVCQVDLGFYTWTRQSCRLAGINCNEISEPGGPEARDELARLLGQGSISVRSVRADKFAGRFDAVVYVALPDGRELFEVNRRLLRDGFAVPWDGRGPRPKVPWPRAA